MSVAVGGLALERALRLARIADIAGAASLDAARGSDAAFDSRAAYLARGNFLRIYHLAARDEIRLAVEHLSRIAAQLEVDRTRRAGRRDAERLA